MKLINIGFGNMVAAGRVVAMVSPESAPIKRIIQDAKERGMLIDATYGRRTRAVLVMDSRYLEAASGAVTDAEVVPYDKAFFDLVKECKEILCEFTLSYAQVAALAKQTAPAELIPSRELSDAVSQMRAVKDAKELARIEAAQALTDAAFVHIQDHLRVGVTERQIALELEFFMRKNGAQSVAFDTIALTGAHGSMPHGVPDDRPIQNGDLVTIAFDSGVRTLQLAYCIENGIMAYVDDK